ncbi:MAG: DUF6485 family protein [Muribaculaceae bacterium]|nr:DUF6485 family protein [Muribaculaceae bacterium]
MENNSGNFCTCRDRKCPLHPANHDKGCSPCMAKNIRKREVPSCLFDAAGNYPSKDGYSFEAFARGVLCGGTGKDIEIEQINCDFSVCKVEDYSGVNLNGEYIFMGKTDGENSLVCPTPLVPQNTVGRDDGWKALRVRGILDFSLTGVLAAILKPLAENGIGIFAISTYNTDYVFIKKENYARALKVLESAGYGVK